MRKLPQLLISLIFLLLSSYAVMQETAPNPVPEVCQIFLDNSRQVPEVVDGLVKIEFFDVLYYDTNDKVERNHLRFQNQLAWEAELGVLLEFTETHPNKAFYLSFQNTFIMGFIMDQGECYLEYVILSDLIDSEAT